MTYLLDTSTLLWAILGPTSLTPKVAAIIADPANKVLVSAVSAWEISTKVRIGKLPQAEAFERDILANVQTAGYVIVPLEAETAVRAGRLTGDHRDPFDRILAAQALADDIPILSIDAKLDAFGVRRIW